MEKAHRESAESQMPWLLSSRFVMVCSCCSLFSSPCDRLYFESNNVVVHVVTDWFPAKRLVSSAGDSSGRSGDNNVGRGVVNCDSAIGKLPPRWTEWDLVYFCWNGLGLPHQWFGVWSIPFFSVNIWHCQHQAFVSILLFLDLEPNKECFKEVYSL